jgi:hypothetical protein
LFGGVITLHTLGYSVIKPPSSDQRSQKHAVEGISARKRNEYVRKKIFCIKSSLIYSSRIAICREQSGNWIHAKKT